MTCPSLSNFYFNVRFSDNFNWILVPALPFILPFTTGLGGGVVSVVLTGLETELFGVLHCQLLLHKHCLQELVCWCNESMTSTISNSRPMIRYHLYQQYLRALGSVVTEIGVNVPPFSEISVSKVGAFGGVVSVALTGSDVELLGTSASSVALTVTLPSGIGFVGVMKA